MKRLSLIFVLISQLVFAQKTDLVKHLQPTVFAVTMVMIHDVVNPPAAARFYSYCTLGAHEIIAEHSKAVVSPTLFVRGFQKPAIQPNKDYNYQLAALYCLMETGRLILPSGYMLEEDQVKFLEKIRKEGFSEKNIQASIAVAQEVAKQVVAFAATDNYTKLSTRVRYRPMKGDGYWYPTPPGYLEAIEPHWRTIKPMMIDTCSQFMPKRPTPFSPDSGSVFYKVAYEVYREGGKNISPEHRIIASFWDCNPFAINTSGHMMIGFKKMSPGGHWMSITNIATLKAKLSLEKSIQVLSLTAITLRDAFISCWDEKYRSNRIRPETVIQRYIDKTWQPLLQTPPFPEYTSGHSVISTAASEVLTYLLGDNFAYTDDTEVPFDLAPRDFTSFRQAAAEAAISRLYGGIHYRDAIENGQAQGRAISEFIIGKLKKVGIRPLI
ncbi:MAG: vanadium-dependent haloperoxidase [Siphonobacter sp.]